MAMLLLSIWVGINGIVFHIDCFDECIQNDYAFECLMWYVPEFSVLWRPFVYKRGLSLYSKLVITYGIIVFFYLAYPIIRTLIELLKEQWKNKARPLLDKNLWRF